jgi:hypothetical protein
VAATLWWPGAAQAQDLALSVETPAEQVADWPFEVTTTWRTDAPRVLSVALLQATACGENLNAGLELDPAALVLGEATVTNSGTRTDEATLVRVGSYLACAYLQSSPDPSAPADIVAQAPITITTYPGTAPSPPTGGVACGDVGGPREITRVRAFSIRCRAARRVARRWGRADERRMVGDYRCRARSRKVTCRASQDRKVTFRFR